MRINANDKGVSVRYRVFLDGVNVTNTCYEADTEAGYVRCYLTNEQGEFVVGKDGVHPDQETRYGKVEIVNLKPEQADEQS